MDTVDQSSDRKGQCDVRSIHWHVKTAPISELNNGVECYSWKICPNVNILSYSWASHHLLEVEEALFRWSTLDLPPFMVQTGPTQHEAPALSPLLSSITLTRKSLPTSRQILFEFSSYLFCISKEWCSSEDAPSESLQERTIKEVAGQWKGWNCSEYLLSGWFSYWRRRCYFFKMMSDDGPTISYPRRYLRLELFALCTRPREKCLPREFCCGGFGKIWIYGLHEVSKQV